MIDIIGKRRYGYLLSAVMTIIGAVWMAPVGWIEMQRTGFSLTEVTAPAWAAVTYLGVGCNFLAVMLYFTALQHTGN